MGYGDEIMVTGRARKMRESDPRKVVVIDGKGLIRGNDPNRPQEYETFRLCPHIEILDRFEFESNPSRRDEFQVLQDAGGHRPYVDRARMEREFAVLYPGRTYTTKGVRDPRLPWRYNMSHRPEVGDISRLFNNCIKFHGDVIVQPYIKHNASPNKQWGLVRWQAATRALVDAGHAVTMLVPPGQSIKEMPLGITYRHTDTWTDALLYLAGARTAVLPDGGVSHAMAALGVPSVVIFGGFTHPSVVGYDIHANFSDHSTDTPCGQWVECSHCRAAMASIGVDDVVESTLHLAANAEGPFRQV